MLIVCGMDRSKQDLSSLHFGTRGEWTPLPGLPACPADETRVPFPGCFPDSSK